MIKYIRCISFVLVLSSLIPTAYAVEIERVSVSSAGNQGNNVSYSPSISADGRFVAFHSSASNLVVGDTNGEIDVFVYDRDLRVIERVSVSSTGVQSNHYSNFPSISADGRFVGFSSWASNLVAGDTNNFVDIFVHDRDSGATERVSVSSAGVQGNNISRSHSISADGRFVAFHSSASNLVAGDTNNFVDIFVHDRDLRVTERVSASSTGVQSNHNSNFPSISADGRFVAFESDASNLVAGDINGRIDVFVHDRDQGITERVSVSSAGVQGNNSSDDSSISADGRFVVFRSNAGNLVVGDTNGRFDVFVHDRDQGVTERVNVSSTGVQGNLNANGAPSISADGRFVAFESFATNLVVGDINNALDIFVHDRESAVTERVSVSSARVQGNSYSNIPSISADGRFVAFASSATNLVVGDTNNLLDIFVSESNLLNQTDDMVVSLLATNGATQVGEYIRFRARLKNNSNATLTNCKALLINPLINIQHIREFNFSTWPIKVANPVINGSIDIAPGETGQMNLAVLPHVAMRREISFEYVCDNASAFTIPFINTVHLTAKTEPLIAEDFVQVKNSNKRTDLIIDRSNGKYWTPYVVKASNSGSEATSVNLTTTSHFPDAILRQSRLCEPIDPANRNWTCINPRDTQLLVELAPGETKKILVYVHARASIEKRVIQNRINLEARDGAGEVVAKTSMGISTIN